MAQKAAVSVTLDISVIQFVNAQKRDDERFSTTLNRIVRTLAQAEQPAAQANHTAAA